MFEELDAPDAGSPKSQYHCIIAPSPLVCDKSVNCTGAPVQATEGKEKFAMGFACTVTGFVTELTQPKVSVIVSDTLKVPGTL